MTFTHDNVLIPSVRRNLMLITLGLRLVCFMTTGLEIKKLKGSGSLPVSKCEIKRARVPLQSWQASP